MTLKNTIQNEKPKTSLCSVENYIGTISFAFFHFKEQIKKKQNKVVYSSVFTWRRVYRKTSMGSIKCTSH